MSPAIQQQDGEKQLLHDKYQTVFKIFAVISLVKSSALCHGLYLVPGFHSPIDR